MADAEDSKSSVGNHVRVQVPPSAPQFFPTVLRFVAQLTLVVMFLAPGLRLTLAELWLLRPKSDSLYGPFQAPAAA